MNFFNEDKILTVQVFKTHLNPRTFKIPHAWINRAGVMAWCLLLISLTSTIYALKERFSLRSARPELIKELESEVQQLKIALEKKAQEANAVHPVVTQTAPTHTAAIKPDPNATDTKPTPGPGTALTSKEGVWSGFASGITAPPSGTVPSIMLEDSHLEWKGNYANFSVNVLFREPGKGSQQGRIVVLARSNDRIIAHPSGVLNASTGDFLFDPHQGEYFSVSRFRPLKTHLGPFENPSQLTEIEVFMFDSDNKLLLVQVFKK